SGGSTLASSTSRKASEKVRSLLAGSKRSTPLSVTSNPRSEARTGSMIDRAGGVGTLPRPWGSNSGSSDSWRSRVSAWPLTGVVFEQARVLGQWFANCRQSFQRVVNGGMTRHRQTADTCLAELPRAALADTEWQTDDGFAEFDHHEVLLRHCPEFADAAAF